MESVDAGERTRTVACWEIYEEPVPNGAIFLRWSIPDAAGKYLIARHYPKTMGGRTEAERDSGAFNRQRRQPEEFMWGVERRCKPPEQTTEHRDKRLAGILEALLGMELLEYHNQNLLALDPKRRSEEKRAMIHEALLLTGQRSDRSHA